MISLLGLLLVLYYILCNILMKELLFLNELLEFLFILHGLSLKLLSNLLVFSLKSDTLLHNLSLDIFALHLEIFKVDLLGVFELIDSAIN